MVARMVDVGSYGRIRCRPGDLGFALVRRLREELDGLSPAVAPATRALLAELAWELQPAARGEPTLT